MNDGTDENDPTGEGRKRPRSDEEDATEMQVQEPPRKQRRRRRSQTIAPADPAQEQQQEQQLPHPWSIDIAATRRIRKEIAMRILSEDLPQMIDRLRDIFRRSKAASDEKWLINTDEGQGSTVTAPGPCAAPRQRKLNREVNQLFDDANQFHQRQHGPLEEEESDCESEETPRDEQLQALSRELALLTEQFRQIHPTTMDNAKKLHQVRLIVEHPAFYELREQVDAPIDPQAPLRDTSELIKLLEAEMNRAIGLSHDLMQWIELSESPMPLVTGLELEARNFLLDIIGRGVEVCEAQMAKYQEYIATRTSLVQQAVQEPLSFKRSRALDSYDGITSIICRRSATILADQCVRLINFVNSHVDILERSAPTEDAAAAVNHL